MGEASRRGTYGQRVKLAKEKQAERQEGERLERERIAARNKKFIDDAVAAKKNGQA